ncbi:MAG: hypothetical protein AAF351_08210 [Pseudomonadota bacterium]
MRILLFIVLTGLFGFLPNAADAADWRDQVEVLVAQQNCKTLQQAVEQVRRKTSGQILSAETRMKGNREEHRIKVLTRKGEVKTHKVQGCRRKNG